MSSNNGETIYDARGYLRHGKRDLGAFEAGHIDDGGNYVNGAFMFRNVNHNFYYTTFADAIAGAQPGENIELFATRYVLASAWNINMDIILTGQGVDKTVLDGGGTSRLLNVTDNAVTSIFVRVAGMSLIGGGGAGLTNGGAIYNAENLSLQNVSIYNSSATSGGAIYNNGGYLSMLRSTLYDNSATSGGAIYNNGGQVRLVESSLYRNTATGGSGGAIYSTGGGSLTITSSALYDNTASVSGGAVYYSGAGKLEFTNSTFADNTAVNGGALYFTGSAAWKLTNVTVAYNISTAAAGYAVEIAGGDLFMVNTLIAENSRVNALIPFDLQTSGMNSTNIKNSIYTSYTPGSIFADNIMTDHGGWSYTLALKSGSVAINGGTNIGVPGYDQRGYDVNGVRDIGAYEYNGIVAYYWDSVTPGIADQWIGTSTISSAVNAIRDWRYIEQNLQVRLVNTRILEADITVNMWANGLYYPETRNVTVYGHQDGDTVISAGHDSRVLTVAGTWYYAPGATSPTYVMGALNLQRLTLTDGLTSGNGGAIATFNGNSQGAINITESSLLNNIATGNGGAIYIAPSANEASFSVSNSLLAYNIATGSGGAVFAGNNFSASDTTFAYNRSFANGGAIALNDNGASKENVTLNRDTLSFNLASGHGGGVYNVGTRDPVSDTLTSGGTLISQGTLYAKNRSADPGSSSTSGVGYDYYNSADAHSGGVLADNEYNLVEYQNGTYTYVVPAKFFNNSNIRGAKEYVFADDYVADHGGWSGTIALDQNSAAKDTGTGSAADQRGYGINRSRDIGAYELNGIVASTGGQNYSTVREALAAVSSGGTVTLKSARIAEYDLLIIRDTTLGISTAPGSFYDLAQIDAQGFGRAFVIKTATVTATLNNLILAHGMIMAGSGEGGQQAAGNGGSIFNAGALTLNEVSIVDSFAQISGGAIYSINSLEAITAGLATVPNTDTSGAYYSRNEAQLNGGAIYASGTLRLAGAAGNNLLFSGNFANAGGAIYGDDVANPAGGYALNYVTFNANSALSGGAFYMDTQNAVSVYNTEFTNNSAMRTGGAVYAIANNALIFSNTDFSNNFSLGQGGALYLTGDNASSSSLSVDNSSNIANNTAEAGSGGAFYIEKVFGDVTISAHNVSANTATGGSGGALYLDNIGGTVSILGNSGAVTYAGNFATVNGGAVYLSNSHGLRIYSTTASNQVTFSANLAANGGAIYMTSSGDLTIGKLSGQSINNVVGFSQNYALNDGGAVYMVGSGNFFAAENIHAVNNRAGYNFNTATWDGTGKGGAFYIAGSGSVTFNDAGQILRNVARNYGGGFYIENSGDVSISYTELAANAAGKWHNGGWQIIGDPGQGQGGALYIKGSGNVTLTDLDVYQSQALAEGGAVYIENGANEAKTVTINSSSFDSNFSDVRGGAVYIDHAAAVNITNTTFAGNNATALYLGYGALGLNFTTFAYNVNPAGTVGTTDAIGIYLAGLAGKTSSFTVNNSLLHDGADNAAGVIAGAPVRLGADVTVAAGASRHNIFTYFDRFAGADNLTNGLYTAITAYLPYGDTNANQTATVLDGYSNIVGGQSQSAAQREQQREPFRLPAAVGGAGAGRRRICAHAQSFQRQPPRLPDNGVGNQRTAKRQRRRCASAGGA